MNIPLPMVSRKRTLQSADHLVHILLLDYKRRHKTQHIRAGAQNDQPLFQCFFYNLANRAACDNDALPSVLFLCAGSGSRTCPPAHRASAPDMVRYPVHASRSAALQTDRIPLRPLRTPADCRHRSSRGLPVRAMPRPPSHLRRTLRPALRSQVPLRRS